MPTVDSEFDELRGMLDRFSVRRVSVTKEKLVEQMLSSLSSERLSHIVEEIANLVAEKNHDYGDAWQTFGCFTALIRINDKLLRVKNLSDGKPALVVGENIVDNLHDVIGYAALALMWIDENADNERKSEQK